MQASETAIKTIKDLLASIEKEIGGPGRPEFRVGQDNIRVLALVIEKDPKNVAKLYDALKDKATAEMALILNGVDATQSQQKIIEKADNIVARYLQDLGLPFYSMETIFVPNKIMPPGFAGLYSNFYRKAIFPESSSGRELLHSTIHELMHRNSANFFSTKRLNEGMTEYLTLKLMMVKEGYADISPETILKYYKTLENPEYLFDVTTIGLLIKKIGEASLLDAYFKDNYALIERRLGASTWREIEKIACESENLMNVKGDQFPQRISEILRHLVSDVLPSLSVSKEEAVRIHAENIKYTPNIPEKTILCHIITDSILPDGQRNILKTLEKDMRDNSYSEKVVSLSNTDPTDFIKEISVLMARERGLYKDYTVKFDIACPSTGLVTAILNSSLGVKALAFEPCKEDAQLEGIIMALRALGSDNLDSLQRAFEFLSGNKMDLTKLGITSIDEFARRIVFILPTAKEIDYEDSRRLNDIIRANIKTAA